MRAPSCESEPDYESAPVWKERAVAAESTEPKKRAIVRVSTAPFERK